jgi:phosphoglycerate dehydrogenase-like enzyme
MFSSSLSQPRSASILQCITAIEHREFLPGDMATQIPAWGDPLVAMDSDELELSVWHQHLHEINPEILVACWSTPALPAALPPALRYVCYLAGSVKKLITRQHIENGLIVTNWGHSISRTVAEGALLHVLTLMRRSHYWAIRMHQHGAWKKRTTQTASLFDRSVGIRGYGRVAHAFIELIRPFGCKVSVLAPDLTPERAAADGVRRLTSIDELMSENQVVVELAPLIDATRGSIKERHLRQLKPGSVFVNVGRGATVDEAALEKVARDGKIFVGLDVFSEEPLPANCGFRGLANVSLTPHLAGPTTDRRIDAGLHSLKNLSAYLNDEPLIGQITLPVYDQST